MSQTEYRAIADRIASEIASGQRRPGERIPPQRDLADQLGIAASTASRVYRELRLRGLVVGEVGRGTFVRSTVVARPAVSSAGPAPDVVNLDVNTCVLPEQAALLARSLAPLVKRPAAFDAALQLASPTGTPSARQTAATFFARAGWTPDPEAVTFAANGKAALAAAIAALVPPGQRLGVDGLTYPLVKQLAVGLGVDLVPLAMDDEGLRPYAIEAAHKRTPLSAIYVQPSIHNPLGMTLSAPRRAAIADLVERLGLHVIEDHVYAFLEHAAPPLAALAPDRAVVIDSLSKRIAPGVTLGSLVSAPALASRLRTSVRAGAWGPSGLGMDLSLRWMADGTAAAITTAKRRDAQARQALLRDAFAGLDLRANPLAYHGWLMLPARWRAETFVAAAAQRRIAITPASAFAVGPAHAPNAVRVAISAPPLDELTGALETLASLAHGGPEAWATE